MFTSTPAISVARLKKSTPRSGFLAAQE